MKSLISIAAVLVLSMSYAVAVVPASDGVGMQPENAIVFDSIHESAVQRVGVDMAGVELIDKQSPGTYKQHFPTDYFGITNRVVFGADADGLVATVTPLLFELNRWSLDTVPPDRPI